MSPIKSANAVDEPPWYEQCRIAVEKMGGKMCPEEKCAEAPRLLHAVCFCEEPYLDGCEEAPHPSPECCSYTVSAPIFMAGPEPCYCCCGYIGEGLLVASGETDEKEAHEFAIGDPVWAAMDAELSRWENLPVVFSAGTGAGGPTSLIRLHFGEQRGGRTVYVNRDQLFLVKGNQPGSERKLKRTSKLVPGKDELLQPDGTAVPIQSLTPGEYERIVHHLATSVSAATGMERHLIVVNGVVGGDYALQVANLERDSPELLVEGHAELPDVCTEEYIAMYPDVDADGVSSAADGGPRP